MTALSKRNAVAWVWMTGVPASTCLFLWLFFFLFPFYLFILFIFLNSRDFRTVVRSRECNFINVPHGSRAASGRRGAAGQRYHGHGDIISPSCKR